MARGAVTMNGELDVGRAGRALSVHHLKQRSHNVTSTV